MLLLPVFKGLREKNMKNRMLLRKSLFMLHFAESNKHIFLNKIGFFKRIIKKICDFIKGK